MRQPGSWWRSSRSRRHSSRIKRVAALALVTSAAFMATNVVGATGSAAKSSLADASDRASLLSSLPEYGDLDLRPDKTGLDYVDKNGTTYDQIGDPAAVSSGNLAEFLGSLRRHLNKDVDYVVIDLRDFPPDWVAAVENVLAAGPRENIIRVGF